MYNNTITINIKQHKKKYINKTLFLIKKTNKKLNNLKKNYNKPSKSNLIYTKKKYSKKLKKKNQSKQNYIKFYKKILKNFFNTTLKQLKLFKKQNYYSILKTYKNYQNNKQQNQPS